MNGLGRRDLSFSAPRRTSASKKRKKRKPPSNTNPPKRPTTEAAVRANRRTSHVTPVCSFGFYCVNSTECKQDKKQLKNRDVIFLFCVFITCGGRRGRRLSLQEAGNESVGKDAGFIPRLPQLQLRRSGTHSTPDEDHVDATCAGAGLAGWGARSHGWSHGQTPMSGVNLWVVKRSSGTSVGRSSLVDRTSTCSTHGFTSCS